MPEQLTFSGDVTTIIGFFGVVSTAIIIVSAFRRFFNSPYNIRVKTEPAEETLISENTENHG